MSYLKTLLFLTVCTFAPLLLKAYDGFHPGSHEPFPLWTGTLLSPGASVLPPNHILEQPYLFVTMADGKYDDKWHSHSSPTFTTINLQFFTLIGLIDKIDFQTNPQWIYNATRGQSSSHFGDFPIGINFQVISKNDKEFLPSIKIGFKEVFPTGKYQKLNPNKLGTQITGTGAYDQQLTLVFFKEFHFYEAHYLSAKLSFIYDHFSRARVKGFNAYGGGYKTDGTVYPGDQVSVLASFEYALTKHWVLALDNVYSHGNRTRFNGHKGYSAPGVKAAVGGPSSENISFAPAIEYNFSDTFGVLGGCWFTACGRNSTQFQSIVLSALYVH